MKKLFAVLIVFVAVALSGCAGDFGEVEPYDFTPEDTAYEQPENGLDEMPNNGETYKPAESCEPYTYAPTITPSPELISTPEPEPTSYNLPETHNYAGFGFNPPEDDQLIYAVMEFTVEFLHAFNSLDEERLRPLMTDEFFTSFQWYMATEPPDDVWGTFWDVLILAGNFVSPPVGTRFVSTTLFGNFVPGGMVDFIFNLGPIEDMANSWIPLDRWDRVLTPWILHDPHDRWNVGISLIYDGNYGFLAHGFGLTYDR